MEQAPKTEDLEYDIRQYTVMLDKLRSWEQTNFPLGELVTDLEALTAVLKLVNEDWKQDFIRKVGTLEEVYAYALFKERDYYTSDDEKLIAEAILFLKEKAQQALLGVGQALERVKEGN